MKLLPLLLVTSILCGTACTPAQQIGTNAAQGKDQTYTLSVKTQLVTETVVIKDKSGKFIPGLTAKDFTVTEDGAPQTIRVFEHESLPIDAAPLPASKPDDENVKIYRQLSRTTVAPEDTGARAATRTAACSPSTST